MFNTGEKVIYIDDSGLIKPCLNKETVYTVVRIYKNTQSGKSMCDVENIFGELYSGYYQHRFESLKEFRKQKINKIIRIR